MPTKRIAVRVSWTTSRCVYERAPCGSHQTKASLTRNRLQCKAAASVALGFCVASARCSDILLRVLSPSDS
eukprot:7381011-Prymnesium_polylepis.1